MTTLFGSFDSSPMGGFTTSPMGARNGGRPDPDLYYCYADTDGGGADEWITRLRGTGSHSVVLDFEAVGGGIIRGMAVDADENIYIDRDDRFIDKHDPAGNHLWTTDLGAGSSSSGADKIEVDFDGNVYMLAAGGVNKLDSSGTLVDVFPYGGAVVVDQSGNIYVRKAVTSVAKLDSSGSEIWTASHGATINSIAVDQHGNVWVGGVASGGAHIRRFSSAGSETLAINNTIVVVSLDCDDEGSVYVGNGSSSAASVALNKYDSSGALVWSANRINLDAIGQIRVDYNHNLHVAWQFADAGHMVYQRYDSSGVLNLSFSEAADRGRAVAVNFGRFGAFGF